jgi:hypothetical protein
MRGCRIVYVEDRVHNQGKKAVHKFYLESPGPSESETDDRLKVVLLSLAEYFPAKGLDLWSGEPEVRDLEEGEVALLRNQDPDTGRSRNMVFYKDHIRAFLWQQVMAQDIGKLDPGLREQVKRANRNRDTSLEVLDGMIAMAVEPARAAYADALANGRLGETAPISPAEVVQNILGETKRKEKMLITLNRQVKHHEHRAAIGGIALGQA